MKKKIEKATNMENVMKIEQAVEKEINLVENEIETEIKRYPKRSMVTLVLLVTLVMAFIEALRLFNWVYMFMIIVISFLIFLPMVIRKLSQIDIPIKLEIFAVLFIYSALFLGELRNYYAKYGWWDILLHTSSGLAFGILGFLILYVIYKTEKIKTSPKIIAMFSFAFSLAIGALWEIVEFTIDSAFGPISNGVLMQGSLRDTMGDLIVDAIGALFSAVMGYLYLKRDSGIVVKAMAKDLKKENPELFKKKESK